MFQRDIIGNLNVLMCAYSQRHTNRRKLIAASLNSRATNTQTHTRGQKRSLHLARTYICPSFQTFHLAALLSLPVFHARTFFLYRASSCKELSCGAFGAASCASSSVRAWVTGRTGRGKRRSKLSRGTRGATVYKGYYGGRKFYDCFHRFVRNV